MKRFLLAAAVWVFAGSVVAGVPPIPPSAPVVTAMQLKARSLLARVYQANFTTVLATPIVGAVGVANANSLILTNVTTGSPTVLPSDTRLTWVHSSAPVSVGGNWTPSWITETSSTSTPWEMQFGSDGAACEVSIRDLASPANRVQAFVNGQLVATNDVVTTTAAGSNFYYVTFDTGSSARRTWDFEFGAGAQIKGINCGPSIGSGTTSSLNPYRVWSIPLSNEPKGIVIGDSYVYGVGQTNINDPLVFQMSNSLGFKGVVASGAGGQGYTAVSNGSSLNCLQRMTAGDVTKFGTEDLVVVAYGINDIGTADATEQANAAACISYIMQQQPNAFIIVFGPWRAPNKQTPSSIDADILAGYTLVADTTRMCYIDTFSTPSYQDATGGNSALYIGADNVHPNTAGHQYLGFRMAQDAMKCLRGFAGIPYA